ncbi:MAG: hypothetical protein ABW188_03590 [Rhodococcus fascians]
MIREGFARLIGVGALLVSLTGCAGGAEPSSTPTVTVTAQPAPAPTVTVEVQRAPDAVLTPLEAWTICASAGLADLGDSGYRYALPMQDGNVTDNGDTTYTVTVNMDTTGGLQPVFVDCEVSGSMGDPRVTIDVNFYDSQ